MAQPIHYWNKYVGEIKGHKNIFWIKNCYVTYKQVNFWAELIHFDRK